MLWFIAYFEQILVACFFKRNRLRHIFFAALGAVNHAARTDRINGPGGVLPARVLPQKKASELLSEREVALPIEIRTGVGLALGSDLGMTRDPSDRIRVTKRPRQTRKRLVLRGFEGLVVAAFELDSDRVVVAARAAFPIRCPGVPRALQARHELDERALPVDDEVRRYTYTCQRGEIRVRVELEPVEEEIRYRGSAEFTWRQADRVNDEQIDRSAGRALVAVRTLHEWHAAREPSSIDFHCGGARFHAGATPISSSRRARP